MHFRDYAGISLRGAGVPFTSGNCDASGVGGRALGP
jgi:hypothetical protein